MKCRDCDYKMKGFFACEPDKYVCIGVKEPFVIEDTNVECTEYPEKREEVIGNMFVSGGIIDIPEPVTAYVGDDGIYVPYEYDMRYHKLLISKDIFVEAYNKWIKGEPNVFDNPFVGQDDADDWCED